MCDFFFKSKLIYPYVCVQPILIYGNLIIMFLRMMKFSIVLDSYSKLNLSTFDFQNFCSMQFLINVLKLWIVLKNLETYSESSLLKSFINNLRFLLLKIKSMEIISDYLWQIVYVLLPSHSDSILLCVRKSFTENYFLHSRESNLIQRW